MKIHRVTPFLTMTMTATQNKNVNWKEGDSRKILSPLSQAEINRRVSTTTSTPSSCATQRRSSVDDGNKIRSRLLSSLGFVQKRPGVAANAIPLRKLSVFSEPLKYDDGDEEDGIKEGGSSVSSTSSYTRTRRSVVAFDGEVSVVHIPKHEEYSKRIRSKLWCDKRELRNMAARNTLEYQSEGWNPSTVVLDEGFITMSNGEKVHPVHIQRLLCSPYFRRPPIRAMQLGKQQLGHQLEANRQPVP